MGNKVGNKVGNRWVTEFEFVTCPEGQSPEQH